MNSRSPPSPDRRGPPRIAWLGDTAAEELALARAWVDEFASVVECAEADAAAIAHPTVALLATHRPADWTLSAAAAVSRRWPLTPLVTVVTSLADGRRRSGPWLPGVEEVAWHDLPGRLTWWLWELTAGRPGTLGLPTTARREERVAEAAGHVRMLVDAIAPPPMVAVAGPCRTSLDGVADLLAAAGFRVTGRTRGRPRLDDEADLLVWDVGRPTDTDFAWLGILAANRPGLGIVLLDSFPRGNTARAAVRAGAAAVLGRPVGLEALVGTLLRLGSRPRNAIGAPGPAD
jgi:hypothetical protein